MENNNYIVIKGARENNLKNINVNIPRGQIVAFVGLSGSGKSSLVFDTIAVESTHQLYGMMPLNIRNRMPYRPQPKVDSVENLSPAVIVDQKQFAANSRSSVGTMTEIAPMIRLMYSRFAKDAIPLSSAYSYNDPQGMCPECDGLGEIVDFDLHKMIDFNKSLNQEAVQLPGFAVDSYQWQMYANSGLFDNDKPLKDYNDKEWHDLLHGSGFSVDIMNNTGKVWDGSYKLTYEGLMDRTRRLYLKKDGKTKSKTTQRILAEFTTSSECPCCHGKRLKPEALASKFMDMDIFELGQMEISELVTLLKKHGGDYNKDADETLDKIIAALEDIVEIGLGYLNLNRATTTLSGGELQRLKIVRHLRSSLVGMTYIFDEPSIGLHPTDIKRVNKLILKLKEQGNSVILVEHNRDVIAIADEIIELGPKAGVKGGQVIFQGTRQEIEQADTPTGRLINKLAEVKKNPRKIEEYFSLNDCKKNNLKGFSVDIPKKAFTVVTGLAGAGKSTLVCDELLTQYPESIYISQGMIRGSNKSSTASYIGILDDIRKLYAKESGKSASLFSRNSKGACPMCSGKGTILTEMAFMNPVEKECEVCGGTGFSKDVLEHLYRGKNMAEVMDLTVEEAYEFFDAPKIKRKLEELHAVGLGYVTLGHSTNEMSGGERQRLKLAAHLKQKNNIYVMDEPTTGLHRQDVNVLLNLFDKLVDSGNTLIVVEHNLDVVASADWVIDMGPYGGKNGGEILYQGNVAELLDCDASFTGKAMKESGYK